MSFDGSRSAVAGWLPNRDDPPGTRPHVSGSSSMRADGKPTGDRLTDPVLIEITTI
jgi:hypothetical protein